MGAEHGNHGANWPALGPKSLEKINFKIECQSKVQLRIIGLEILGLDKNNNVAETNCVYSW